MHNRRDFLNGIVLVCVAALAAGSSEGALSESFTAFLRPGESSFWRTAPGSSVTVPVDFPSGAQTAALTVKGVGSGYSKVYDGISGESFEFELPEAVDSQSEDVYELTLTFDDETKTVRTAKIALVKGLMPDASGKTRCLVPEHSRKWNRVIGGRAVVPVPYGATSLTVDGAEHPGLDGKQGWCVLKNLESGETSETVLTVGGETYAASLMSAGGLLFLVR